MKLRRQVELHPQGVVILEPDANGFVKRDTAQPQQGDWYLSDDRKTKFVMNSSGQWETYVDELPSLDEMAARMSALKKAQQLQAALHLCDAALIPEHGTTIFNLQASGVADTERSIILHEPKAREVDPYTSILTHEDCLEVIAKLRDVIKSRLDTIKTLLQVR